MIAANIVREFDIGNTHIQIADNYCRQKTSLDVERSLKTIAEQAQRQFIAAAAAQKRETLNCSTEG